MQFRIQDLLLSLQNVIGKKLLLHVLKSKTLDGLCKTLASLSLLTEQQDSFLDHGEGFFLIGKYLGECLALSHFLTPASADVDLIAVGSIFNAVERTFSYAASAVVTDILVNLHHSVYHLCRIYRTSFLHRTLLAAIAVILLINGDPLSDDAKVIEIRLYAVVGASAHGDLKLVGKQHLTVSLVESVVNLLGKFKGIQKSVLAGGSLTCYHRTHLGASSACYQAGFCDVLAEIVNLVVGNALYLDGQTCGKGYDSVAELLSGFTDDFLLLCGDFSVNGNDTAGKIFRLLD